MNGDAPIDNTPRYAMYQGKRVRVVDYQGNGYFRILLSNDTMTNVKRERLTFVKSRKK